MSDDQALLRILSHLAGESAYAKARVAALTAVRCDIAEKQGIPREEIVKKIDDLSREILEPSLLELGDQNPEGAEHLDVRGYLRKLQLESEDQDTTG